MSEFKVKEVTKEEKSKVEVENDLLKAHEEKFQDADTGPSIDKVNLSSTDPDIKETEDKQNDLTPPELNDDDVISYIKNRYDKDITSVDELFAEKEANVDLPDDVSAYFKYKQETGRGIEDFYNLQKNFDEMDDNVVLANYYSSTEEGLDEIDIQDIIEKYLDESGLIKDAVGYHKALSVAMNPDKFAQYFYDQGVANTVDNVSRKSKNINMDVRQQSQTISKDGMKIRPVSSDNRNEHGRGLKIRSIKKS